MDPAEIVVPLTNEQVSSLWKDNEYWQRACSNFLGEINNCYPKSKRIEFIKKTEWVLPHIVRQKPISGVFTFYTDANKLGKAGYKPGDLSKVVQSPYNSVHKAELYDILMVLMDFTEALNIVTGSQYAERVVLHIETAEFIPDNTELTSLFIKLQEIIRNKEQHIYINTYQIPYRTARTSSIRIMKYPFSRSHKALDIQMSIAERKNLLVLIYTSSTYGTAIVLYFLKFNGKSLDLKEKKQKEKKKEGMKKGSNEKSQSSSEDNQLLPNLEHLQKRGPDTLELVQHCLDCKVDAVD
ncbi:hypothetical protein STEG23_000298 [Scotinomys teguina]